MLINRASYNKFCFKFLLVADEHVYAGNLDSTLKTEHDFDLNQYEHFCSSSCSSTPIRNVVVVMCTFVS